MTIQKEIPVLHPLRAIASLSVCLFHFVCTVIGFVDSDQLKQVLYFGQYGVQIFFVISGFIIPWSMYHSGYSIKNYFTFILKRFIRLEPPYILSLILAVGIAFLRELSPHYNHVDKIPSLKQVLLHFGYLIPFFKGEHWIREVYWTLAIEFQYYILLGLLFCLVVNKKLIFRVVSYGLILSGPFLFSGFLPYYFPVFLFGISVFLYKSQFIGKQELVAVTILAAVVVFVFHDLATLIAAGFTYISILFFTNFNNRVFQFLGNISYSVYLFHGLVGTTMLNYFSHTAKNPLYKFLLLVSALVITIVTSYLVFRCVELPSKKLSSKIKFKKNS